MIFEWFRLKAESNIKKHEVSFDEAKTAFDDPAQIHYPDLAHSIEEDRFICVGMSDQGQLLMVVYTEPEEDRIRIISARKATNREEEIYVTQSNDT